ncbi:ribosome-recycling factor, mitochondrial-like [Physella acuta]|uniref:ribosome-recycling factor, mitochondrial-like n=1 Tax=Physella acuta TaxID=109671 RepID=UPI0027DC4D3C|nr:ribosome-recycling factor, mitochondrial-like [Physella acuta]
MLSDLMETVDQASCAIGQGYYLIQLSNCNRGSLWCPGGPKHPGPSYELYGTYNHFKVKMASCLRSKHIILSQILKTVCSNSSSTYHVAAGMVQFRPKAIVPWSKSPCTLHQVVLPSPTSVSWCIARSYAKKGKDKGGKAHKKMTLTDDQLSGLVDIEKVREEFTHVLKDLKEKFVHQLTVRTSQGVFDNLIVKTAEGNFPLIQLGQVIVKNPQLIAIDLSSSPQYITNVKETLLSSGLNVNPQQDGTSLFIAVPKVTREHRETLAKNAKQLSEKSKKHLRDVYSKYSKKIKTSQTGHSADDLLAAEEMIKDLMHEVQTQIEEMTTSKQEELMGGR